MRKAAVIIAVLAFTATAAMAYPGGGRWQGGQCFGYGQGAGGFGPGYGPGMGGRGLVVQQDGKVIDDTAAKAKVQNYLKSNLKGFEIDEAVKVQRPRGTMYRFTVKDKSGNMFVLRVNPFGYLMGPIPVQAVK